MLDACASGYTKRKREHNWLVMWNGRSFPNLPVGEHGKREDPEIQIGHVKKMIRHLDIDLEKAKKYIERLK